MESGCADDKTWSGPHYVSSIPGLDFEKPKLVARYPEKVSETS